MSILIIREMPKEAKVYVRRPLEVKAVQIHQAFELELDGSVLTGRAGDYLVRDEFGRFVIIDEETFNKLYTATV